MDINWRAIKEKLLLYCKNAFAENNIILTQQELEEDVVVFYNFVSLSLPYPEIGNIRKEMMSGLQAALIDDIGAVEHLKSVATLFDAYMKKLITYADINTFERVKDKSQMPLLREFNYWGLSIPDYKESNIDHFKGAADASYLLGMTILTRNKVHLSPVMDDSEVTLRLKCVVSFYVYLIQRTKTALLRKNPALNKSDFHYFGDNPDDALLYDYISYGNSSVQIKKRYVSTYAKHQLYSTGTLTEQELIEKLKNFSGNSLKDAATKRIVDELASNKDIKLSSHVPKKYTLTDKERARIQDAEENYNMSLQSFNNSMQETITRYGLRAKSKEVTKLLMQYLAAQYNYDIEEALGDVERSDKPNCHDFMAKLKDLGCPADKCKDLFKELLCISRDNDVLIRVSAGRAYQTISNPERFDEYVRKADRKVWLDTQILLYLLCDNEDYAIYDHPSYRTAMALFRQPAANNYFHFQVAQSYISELTNQLRLALLLIGVVDLPFVKGRNMSQNVFYRHYRKLHDNSGLPNGIESFADYMRDNFNLSEEDAFESDYDSIAEGVVEGKLEQFRIKIERLLQQSNKEISNSEEIFRQVAKNLGIAQKPEKTLLNDAMMGSALFKHEDQQKPIFITMDNSFEPYRKLYLSKYKRASSFNWHLFSPAEFLNHIDFIDFKVNAENLTDSLISIIETSEVKDKTLDIIDRVNRFLDIPQISNNQRKKYMGWVNDLFQSDEFAYKADTPEKDAKSSGIYRFLDAQDSVTSYFSEKDEDSIKNFQLMLKNEDGFREYLEVLKKFSSELEANKDDLILAVEMNLEDFMKLKELSVDS